MPPPGHARRGGDDDEPAEKGYDWQLLRRLLGYLRPYRRLLLVAVLAHVLVAALGPLRPWLSKLAIDQGVVLRDPDRLAWIVGGFLALLLLQAAVLYGLTYLMQYLGQHVIHDLRVRVHAHINTLDLRYFDRTPVGKLVTRVTSDIDALNELFSSGIVMMISDVLVVCWILVFMLAINWRLALITLVILPPLVMGTMWFRRRVRDAFRATRKHLASLNSFMQERVTGIEVVHLFAQAEREGQRFATINADYRAANVRTVFYYALYFPFVEILSAVAFALILWYGGGLARAGSLVTLGEIVAFIQFTDMFFRPIFDLSDKYNVLQSAMAAAERLFQVLDTAPAIRDPAQPRALPTPVRGAVTFEHVTFAYDGDQQVLRDLSFSIAPGETVAIVGHTGAGKTTIISLLARFYDVSAGRILVDGVDVRELRQQDLRRALAIVLQDVFLFAGTAHANISLENPAITPERVRAAAVTVGADRFLDRLPQGDATVLTEGGLSLSAGERQLLAFARALAHDPAILVLDEATASVDSETEQLIQRGLARLLAQRTAIVIAHRLSTIKSADRILVLHHGELREQGKHQELLARRGIYHRLYQLQYREQEAVPA